MLKTVNPKIALIIAIVLSAAGWSCEKATTPEGDPPVNLTQFQGTWQGSIRIVRAGDCQLNNKDTLLINDTRLYWTVDADGYVSANEDHFFTSWSGKIWPSLGVELVKINNWSQGGTTGCDCVDSDTTEYLTTIVRNAGGAYEINMTSTETWCPPNEGRFVVKYSLTKQ
ncbi:MAG: hypothetical protein OEV49_03520 [candidate division Zixibacteria bacterium]|nr:hypothetical protein [candidate division Zixibacteria bacterium]MDH3938374.1 hypothetical protein [candidate division Zixibacteria bacterium]MDH4033517.1 hypothetical protein [candidate division Zixibacteria bacterium]